jgi:hypothetical protein
MPKVAKKFPAIYSLPKIPEYLSQFTISEFLYKHIPGRYPNKSF